MTKKVFRNLDEKLLHWAKPLDKLPLEKKRDYRLKVAERVLEKLRGVRDKLHSKDSEGPHTEPHPPFKE
jgi:hypothetical protein